MTQTTRDPPQTIYLIDIGDQLVWCDVPGPHDGEADVWEYQKVRKVTNGTDN